MTALKNLFAPDALPDIESDAYQAALAILEDHPGLAGMTHTDRSSLAQRLVETVGEHADPDEILSARDEAYDVYEEILARPKLPKAVHQYVPDWARQRYAGENPTTHTPPTDGTA